MQHLQGNVHKKCNVITMLSRTIEEYYRQALTMPIPDTLEMNFRFTEI